MTGSVTTTAAATTASRAVERRTSEVTFFQKNAPAGGPFDASLHSGAPLGDVSGSCSRSSSGPTRRTQR